MSNLIGAQTRGVVNMQRGPRLIAGQVDGTGTAAVNIGSAREFTLTDNGTGDYTLTFGTPFARVPVVVATSLTTGVTAEIGTVSASSAQILGVATGDGSTATDMDFNVMIVGFDAADEI